MTTLRCDFCAITAKVLAFSVIRTVRAAGGRRTTRGCGTIQLCQRCWRTTAGRRMRRRPAAARAAA